MLARFWPALFAFVALPFAACSGGDRAPATAASGDDSDSGTVYTLPRDSGVLPHDAAPVKVPWARMDAHQHKVLPAMRLAVVYIGDEGVDGPQSFDGFVDWLLQSDYWGIMKQYGVDRGTRVASIRLPRSSVIPDGVVTKGLISALDLQNALRDTLHPPGSDAGADADPGAGDGGSDASSTDGSIPPEVALADAYIFFLPIGVNVNLGNRGGHVFQTCIDAGGYHSFDGIEPYAVIPPCTLGRSPLAVSHELAEMATDPFPGEGWYSAKDVENGGGEIGDLCNQVAPHGADGWDVTQLWSNADGDCEPN